LITKLYSADQDKRDVVGGACGSMGEGRVRTVIVVETWDKQITGKK